MFRIETICFWHGRESQSYKLKKNTFIYGQNTVGKTAFTMAIDFVLGSSEKLTYQGLDNIDSVEAQLSNGNTNLWVKRTITNEFFYKRTEESEYSVVSKETYKNNICLMLNDVINEHFLEVYEKVFDEIPTFRSFIFLNFIEEKGLGDLGVIFTRGKELKHQTRIRNIMNYFFNYENIEQLFTKKIELEKTEKEYASLKEKYLEYNHSMLKVKKIFGELHLKYIGEIVKDMETFADFKAGFNREKRVASSDLIYLSRASFSLAEEMKLFTFMQEQSQFAVGRKERISRLLTTLQSIIAENPEYEEYSKTIIDTIKNIQDENVILSLTDYPASIKKIKEEKIKIDSQIANIKEQAKELEYEDVMKKIGVLESCFSAIDSEVDMSRIDLLQEKIQELKGDIKKLNNSFNKINIDNFNDTLTNAYIDNDLDIKHLREDRQESEFKVEFDPFRLVLLTSRKREGIVEHYVPGSMARQTHLQILTYLCMFDYLNKKFNGFIYLPLLIIDSANQPMGVDVFEKVYPSIINFANQIGLQTIFLSKDKIKCVNDESIINISTGLNKFHVQKKR